MDYGLLGRGTENFSHTSTNSGGIVFGVRNMSYAVSHRASVFLMPGYAFAPDKLGYVKLGYSGQTLTYKQLADPISGLNKNFSESRWQHGFIIGLGYKQIIADGFYGFAEANYLAYTPSTISGDSFDGQSSSVIRLISGPSQSAHNVLFGVGYAFH